MPVSPFLLDSVIECQKTEAGKGPLAVLVIATVLSAIVFFLWVTTDYGQVWVHPEYFYQIDRHTVPDKHFTLKDLSGFFDCNAIGEQCQRARFLNNLITSPVIKTRLRAIAKSDGRDQAAAI